MNDDSNNFKNSSPASSITDASPANNAPIPTWPLPDPQTQTEPITPQSSPDQSLPTFAPNQPDSTVSPTQDSPSNFDSNPAPTWPNSAPTPPSDPNSPPPAWPPNASVSPPEPSQVPDFGADASLPHTSPTLPTPEAATPQNPIFPNWSPAAASDTQAPKPSESFNSVFPNLPASHPPESSTLPSTPTNEPTSFQPQAPTPAPVSPAPSNDFSGPLTLNSAQPNANPFAPTDHSAFMPQEPQTGIPSQPAPENTSAPVSLNTEPETDQPLNLSGPSSPAPNTFTSTPANPPQNTPFSLSNQPQPAADPSQMNNTDPLSSPLYNPPIAGDNVTMPVSPAGLPETFTPAKKGGVSFPKGLVIGGFLLLVLIGASVAYFMFGMNKNSNQDTLSLPAEAQEQGLTNPPKPIIKATPTPNISATASPSATPKVASASALQRLREIKQASSSSTSSAKTQ